MKPILKWVGGKTQLLETILKKIPNKMDAYHELFVGGGAVLLGLLESNKQIKNAYAYDINKALIYLYKNIQSNESFWETFVIYRDKMKNSENKKDVYYEYRTLFNNSDPTSVEASVLFLILNKTCFRGLYREGPNGFNVPYGHYKSFPEILTKETYVRMRELIKEVTFIHSSYETVKVKKNDFVYADPPYYDTFVDYNKSGFKEEEHTKLFNYLKNLKCKFIMSNSNTEKVKDAFEEDACYKIEIVDARRAINSKNPAAKTTEILVLKT